jgi:DNA integrity scanning protein DisA with diadenylate cyclase activity
MIASLLGGIVATPWARAILRYGAIAVAIVLFLLSIRRAAEHVGRIAERLEFTEKNNAIQRRMLEAAARRPRDRGELVDRLRNGGF